MIRLKLGEDATVSAERVEQYRQLLALTLEDPVLDRALGSIYGAMIGDALGAYCEFNRSLEEQTVDEAMEMNGGGTFGLVAGQFTDDSELASHLLQGLSFFDEDQPLSRQESRLVCRLAEQYIQWEGSGPFDIGTTTRVGISTLRQYQP